MIQKLNALREKLQGDLYTDTISLVLYSTDASAYKEKPLAVVRPRNTADVKEVVSFACTHGISVIPRATGTSLAGQVVGSGIVLDVTKYMNKIIEVNPEERWVIVEPGVVLDELNIELKKYGLFFAPETSTANRCTLGGMLGNNACGAHSLIYGSTRDHVLAVDAILSDGSEVRFEPLDPDRFFEKLSLATLEGDIYRHLHEVLSDPQNQENIRREYPEPSLRRRNTGYAVDEMLNMQPFTVDGPLFNMCKLVAGSEGTLAFATRIKLNLEPLPPSEKALVCAHFVSLEEALEANLIALDFKPDAIELIDNVIIECTKQNIEQRKNRFFIEGEPGAILVIEFAKTTVAEIEIVYASLVSALKTQGYGYHFPLIRGGDIQRVWALRKAGLGLLSNIPGDAKPVSVIEDTAVDPRFLPSYITDFKAMLAKYNLKCVYHAHIATGELHLRPLLNLKDPEDLVLFRKVATDTAHLVKKYKGSLSGEHGDGRLRGEFIPIIIGQNNFEIVKQIKKVWDPVSVFNRHKVVDTPPMDTSLRYNPGVPTKDFDTIFDFSSSLGILRMAENCNGSGDCRKSEIIGGTMCPSFMATRDERNTTRARANILREFLTNSQKKNPFDHKEIYDILDLCLSCKACKAECPSNVDMAKLKAEFLQHYYDTHGVPFRVRVIAWISSINRVAAVFPTIYNAVAKNKVLGTIIKKTVGFAPRRSLPLLYKTTLRHWTRQNLGKLNENLASDSPRVALFIDEFTNYNDAEIGIKAIKLLNRLGYYIVVPNHSDSGRTFISKGLLRKARSLANANVESLSQQIGNLPLIGIEPSAILTFRDEYPELVRGDLREIARQLAGRTLLIEEFLAAEFSAGRITSDKFTSETKTIKFHGHCQQKAVASTAQTKAMLSIPVNYAVEELKTGCCGMAGSFGYEREHYDISMRVGELVLFPEIRKAQGSAIFSAPGTSCRHQIKDGTGEVALHPVEVLFNALV